MTRKCSTCQHLKRAEIDRRLAAGEPGNQIAREYDLNPSSLHRHRVNCVGLSPSNAIMKETARGSPALGLLPAKEDLNATYGDLRASARASIEITIVADPLYQHLLFRAEKKSWR
jgi:hypothetical protein